MLIDKLNFNNLLTVNEFVKDDKSDIMYEIIYDKEIIKTIHPKTDDMKMIDISSPNITYDEVIELYDKMIVYLKQQKSDCNKLKFIKRLKKDVLKYHFISARQVNLDDFITII